MKNLFREEYKALTPEEIDRVDGLKKTAYELLCCIGDTNREQAIARTKLEECVMWATKGITG